MESQKKQLGTGTGILTNCKECLGDRHDSCLNNGCLCAIESNHNAPTKEAKLIQEFTNKAKQVMPTREEFKELQKKYDSEKKRIFQIGKNKKNYQIKIRKEPIQELRPITLLDNNTRMILVYLPVEVEEITENNTEKEFVNRAFFVCSGNESKKVIPFDSNEIKQNYKCKVQQENGPGNWDYSDIEEWLNTENKQNPKELFELMADSTKHYLDFDKLYDYSYFTLWNIHTYFYELFDATPYNDYTGTKRAGKSKAMEFQKLVCYNAIMSPDMSPSSLFRIIEGTGATLLLDETEQFKNKKNESAQHTRTLLMQGNLKDQFAIRSQGNSDSGFTPQFFNLYCPKSLAHINEFDSVLEDRCIQQIMRRSKDKSKLNSYPDNKRDSRFNEIRQMCYRLFLDYAHEIKDLETEARGLLAVSGRELKIWTPIITLALFFEKNGVTDLTKTIIAKVNDSSEDRQIQDLEDSYDLKILEFITNYGTSIEDGNNRKNWKTVARIYAKLNERKEYHSINLEYLTDRKLSSILKRLGFLNKKQYDGIAYLIDEDSIKDINERMNPTPNQTTLG